MHAIESPQIERDLEICLQFHPTIEVVVADGAATASAESLPWPKSTTKIASSVESGISSQHSKVIVF